MTTRRLRSVAALVGGLAVTLVVGDLFLIALGNAAADEGGAVGAAIWTLGIGGAPAVGAVLATRRPHNPYGWLLLSFGIFSVTSDIAGHYAEFAHATGRDGVIAGGLVESALWPSFPIHLPLLLLFFPDGRLPSRRWRWLPRVVLMLGGAAVLLAAFIPGELGVAGVDNPYAPVGVWGTIVEIAVFATVLPLFACVVAAAGAMVARWRRATGQERLQLRWFASAAALLAGVLVLTGAGAFIANEIVNSLLFSGAMAALFSAIGVAVLRYRLYEIDRIISRTVTYATVTVVVIAVYLAAVTLVTRLTAPVTGDSPIAVAAATLAAAAVIRPARRRIQTSVDRRFNRARYDAERTAAAYRARLRDQLDIETIADDLAATARTVFEPNGVVLWLREGART